MPFFSKSMSLLLSCTILVCAILYPCSYMQYLENIILAMESSTTTTSSYVEFFPFILFFVENLYTNIFPRDIMAPFCPRHSSCTTYKASTQNFTTDMSSTLKASFSSLVPLKYFYTCFSFPRRPHLVSSHVW